MKVQISDMISKKERDKNIDYRFEIPQFEFEGDIIKAIDLCEVVGRVSTDVDILLLKAKIKTTLEMV